MVEIDDLVTLYKSVHFTFPRRVHKKLRMVILENELSMQSVFREVAERIANEETYMMKLLEDVKAKKLQAKYKQLSSEEVDDIYRLLEDNDND